MKAGWEIVKLDAVIDNFIVPQRDKPKVFDGNIPWCRIEDFNGIYLRKSKSGKCVSQETIETMPLRVFPINTVIVSCSADLGRCAVIATPLVTNQTFIGLVPSKKIDSLYLYYLMSNKANLLNSMASGATIKYLSKKKFQSLQVPIPPLAEQKEIVAILDRAFAAIERARHNLQRNIANAGELFQSRLNEIFSQKGEGWEEKKLGDVCQLFQGLAINVKTKHLLVEKSNLPLLRIKDLKKGTHEQYVAEKGYPTNAKVEEHEIIYTRTGNSLGLVFRGRIGILHNNSFKIIPCKKLSGNYLFWWLQHEAFKTRIISLASKAAQPDITHKLFKQQTIIVPPIDLQNTFYESINELNELKNRLLEKYDNKLESLDELKKSILQKAFAGELTGE